MNTKFNIGQEVYVKGKIAKIYINCDGTVQYRIATRNNDESRYPDKNRFSFIEFINEEDICAEDEEP